MQKVAKLINVERKHKWCFIGASRTSLEDSIGLQTVDQYIVFYIVENLPHFIGVCGAGEVRVDVFTLPLLNIGGLLFV